MRQPSASRSRQMRELRILNAIAEALNSAPGVQQALTRTLALVADLLGLKTGWIWLVDPQTGQFYNAGVQHLPPYLQEPVRMTGSRCWCIEAFEDGDLTPKNVDILECSRLRPAVKTRQAKLTEGLAYHASIPLYFQGQPRGILNVAGPAWRELLPHELRLLSTIAYQVGIALERARLAEEATRLARAEERARLARDIHDTLAQGLTAITLQIEGALNHLEGRPQLARERLQSALAVARENLEEARRSVLNLRASPLEGKPLAEALGSLARAFTSDTGIRVQLSARVRRDLPLRVEAELYRIAQEALSNVGRHARAHQVFVSLAVQEGEARLAIRDDGEGFDAGLPRPESHGLLGMRERARLLGGRLRLWSRSGKGTRVTATVPLEAR